MSMIVMSQCPYIFTYINIIKICLQTVHFEHVEYNFMHYNNKWYPLFAVFKCDFTLHLKNIFIYEPIFYNI